MTALQIITILISVITIVLSSVFSYLNLKKTNASLKQSDENIILTKKALLESYKPDIVFYITQPTQNSGLHNLNIKNFGNRAGILLSITLEPRLSYTAQLNREYPIITDCTNIFLTPLQEFSSKFYFKDYPNNKFKVTIKYKTIESDSEIFINKYIIDLDYTNSLLHSK